MAKEDYIPADRVIEGLTAGDKVAETTVETPDADAAAAAEAAGVSSAAYVDYATALTTYEARADIESLADRRAREAGDQFADAGFMRATADGTPPSSGTPDGNAPASA